MVAEDRARLWGRGQAGGDTAEGEADGRDVKADVGAGPTRQAWPADVLFAGCLDPRRPLKLRKLHVKIQGYGFYWKNGKSASRGYSSGVTSLGPRGSPL